MSTTDLSAHLAEQDFEAHDLKRGFVILGHRPLESLTDDRPRTGRCYELSWDWIMSAAVGLTLDQLDIARPRLEHGSIEGFGYPRIGHAWVTWIDPAAGARRACDPVHRIHGLEADWRRFTRARIHRSYDTREAMRRADKAGNTGPWHTRPFGYADCPHGRAPRACDIVTCPGAAEEVLDHG